MRSPIAGIWYQDSTAMLRYDMAQLVPDVPVLRRASICAVVVPHARYRFSGRVAASVFHRVDPRRFQRILVFGPSHYLSMENRISIPDATHYATPLGQLAADTDWIAKARKLPFITCEAAAHEREHSEQLQLPLLQSFVSTRIPVVCLVCGQFDHRQARNAGTALRELIDEKTLVVASSDFTHFGATFGYEPVSQGGMDSRATIDRNAFELFASRDVDGFLHYVKETGVTLCGRDPLALLITMMPEQAKVSRIAIPREKARSPDDANVNYIGAVVEGSWKEEAATKRAEPVLGTTPLEAEEGEQLLRIARNAIRRAFKLKCRHPIWGMVPAGVTPNLKTMRGGFVSIRRNGELRGHTGEVFPRREIWKAITEQALNAAFHDDRFDSLLEAELESVEIEASVLTQPKRIPTWESIRIGTHGIVFRKGTASAVLLPQKPVEAGWNLRETLIQLSLQAGLSMDAWKENAEFWVFEAQVFRERREETAANSNRPDTKKEKEEV